MAGNIVFRLAASDDIDKIWDIILQAKAQMKRLGSVQWDESYPSYDTISNDIENSCGYVIAEGNNIVAYGVVGYNSEPVYCSIEGKWITDTDNYVVLHRLAVSDTYKRQGYARMFLRFVEQLAAGRRYTSFRVDTNYDNTYMLSVLRYSGFSYCGRVRYARGERLAFEKVL